jgi:hypothetical protein
VKTIVEESVKVKLAYVYNSTKTYSAHLHTDCEHAQTLFSHVHLNKFSFLTVKYYGAKVIKTFQNNK